MKRADSLPSGIPLIAEEHNGAAHVMHFPFVKAAELGVVEQSSKTDALDMKKCLYMLCVVHREETIAILVESLSTFKNDKL